MIDLQSIPKSVRIVIAALLALLFVQTSDLFDVGNIDKLAESVHTYTNALKTAEEALNAR